MIKKSVFHLLAFLQFFALFILFSCGNNQSKKNTTPDTLDSITETAIIQDYKIENTLLLLPSNPVSGEQFRIFSTGGKNLIEAKIIVNGPSGDLEPLKTKTGKEIPFWKIDYFRGSEVGKYLAKLEIDNKEVAKLEFEIGENQNAQQKNIVWKTIRGWDSATETMYSAWINALFEACDEQSSWPSLHEVTQNSERNFLYNHLSLDEDNPESKNKVKMEPDCADNPFFLRAYFAWKLGLPFAYHICDRGYIGKNPSVGRLVTNETSSSKSNPVQAFNAFARGIMDGVHSGTARTALDNENSDYYPLALERNSLRPGTVFADPYGHTFILVSWIPQTTKNSGKLLAVDAQPDKTIAIKRFWKGNFLFNTSEVVGEPGFKAFRPILFENGKLLPVKNEMLTSSSGFAPISMQQKGMESEVFYRTMDRLINPKPLDTEAALLDLIQALHEQLQVRVKSVANGEAYMQTHRGTVIPMPSNAKGVFLTGGAWENFSTPNRDLRLLIAMDAVIDFPARVAKYPEDFKIPLLSSPEKEKEKLQSKLDKTVTDLSITYTRTDGSLQEITLAEILKRRAAFEMAYNPNDGIEIRWGAPENSAERETCKRKAPANQQKTMQEVRKWFSERLHPPT